MWGRAEPEAEASGGVQSEHDRLNWSHVRREERGEGRQESQEQEDRGLESGNQE